jgi:hypothetical protein
MKRKTILLIGLIALSVLGFSGVLLFRSEDLPSVGTFELEDFQWHIENFPSDKNVGAVDDAETAIKIAKELWIEEYSKIRDAPIKVFFDKKNDCWYVCGTLPKNMLGGVPHALIQKDGTVIAVWHDD